MTQDEVLIFITKITKKFESNKYVIDKELATQTHITSLELYNEFSNDLNDFDISEYKIVCKGSNSEMIQAHRILFGNDEIGLRTKDAPSFWEELQLQIHKSRADEHQRDVERQEHQRREKLDDELRRDGKKSTCYDVDIIMNDQETAGPKSIAEFIECYEPKQKSIDVLHKLKDGDLIDTIGYRGSGIWYNDNGMLYKNIGHYGYFIHSSGWNKVVKYGLQYFSGTGAQYIMMPDDLDILIVQTDNQKKKKLQKSFSNALDLEEFPESEEYIIDGHRFNATLYELY